MLPETYRRILSIRGVRLPLAGATVGRLPFAGGPLATLLLVQAATGSFADAGLVNACYSIGAAVGFPSQGRVVDRIGQTRVIAVTTVLSAVGLIALVALAESESAVAPMAASAAFAGLTSPPIGTSIRTLWSDLVPDERLRQSAFAVDAVSVEVSFITGPLLIAVVIAVASPAAAVLVNVALSVIGSALLAVSAASRRWRGERHDLGFAGPLRSIGVLVLMGTMLGIGIAVAATELGMTALAADAGHRALAGTLIAAQAAGSLLGGLAYGARTWHGPASRRLFALSGLFVLTTIPLVFAPTLASAFPLMLVSGVALAPVVSVLYVLLDRVSPPGTATEATGWVLTAFIVGAAIGAGTAGAAVNASGAHAGIAVGLAGGVLTALVTWLGQRRLESASGVLVPEAKPVR